MVVKLYNFSKRPNSTKQPSGTGTEYHVCMIENTSIINPRFSLKLPQNETFIDNNYAYIPYFNRYYFITDISWDNGLWILSMSCDVLATAKAIIGQSTQYVIRSASDYDGSVVDTAYPTKSDMQYECVVHDNTIYGTIQPCYIVGIIGGMTPNMINNSDELYNGSVIYYCLYPVQLYQLMRTLLGNIDFYEATSAELSKAIQKQLFNPIQYIHSVKCIPFFPELVEDLDVTQIQVGFNTLTVQEIPTPPQ